IRELMELRDPIYREVSDYVVKTDRRSPRAVVQEIARIASGEA
ncbi:MAG: shikimate kinase AroK, partial [Pseudomonadota bacterium]|nr:shikimate kinase AroK [Pseudomonadota bacterium]